MKTMLIDSKIELTTGVHLLRFSKSFLDIPGAAWDLVLLIYLFCSSKRGSKVRAAHRRKISDLGFFSDLARVVASGPRRAVLLTFSGAGRGAPQVFLVLERLQRRLGVLQCGDLVSLRRFQHARSRKVTNRARLVRNALHHGGNSSPGNGEVTFRAFGVSASLVVENQQSSMRKTSRLAAG
jgi:hypothetical protein